MRKKGLTGNAITDVLIWIAFFIIASGAVYFVIKRMTA